MGLKRNISLTTHIFYKYLDPNKLKRWNLMNLLINNIENNANLPKDIKFGHGGGTVIGSDTQFGKNVFIGQNVTFGSKRNNKLWKNKEEITAEELEQEKTFPTIGDNVKIHANCVIVGGITIGNNSIIGAGTFIDKNIPEDSIVYAKQNLIIKPIEERNINRLTERISFKEEDKKKIIKWKMN